jgi:NIMA (never in mitosis gene a)-related kinase 2
MYFFTGQGSFGIIRKVRHRATGQILCRKEISYSKMGEKEKLQLKAELDVLASLKHVNIVQYWDRQHLKSSHDLHLYMEYCGNGDLGGYIKKLKDRDRYADEDFVWAIFAQLVCALYRCHYSEDPPKVGEEGKVTNKKPVVFQTKEGRRMILHRDLKPENGKWTREVILVGQS